MYSGLKESNQELSILLGYLEGNATKRNIDDAKRLARELLINCFDLNAARQITNHPDPPLFLANGYFNKILGCREIPFEDRISVLESFITAINPPFLPPIIHVVSDDLNPSQVLDWFRIHIYDGDLSREIDPPNPYLLPEGSGRASVLQGFLLQEYQCPKLKYKDITMWIKTRQQNGEFVRFPDRIIFKRFNQESDNSHVDFIKFLRENNVNCVVE